MKDRNIASLEHFIEAARDSGYTNVATALAELIDNAFEAAATSVRINFEISENEDVSVFIEDDGCGMTPTVLELYDAFQFTCRCGALWYGIAQQFPKSSSSI